MKNWLLLFLLPICCSCCDRPVAGITPIEYIAWVEDSKNGLMVSKEVENFQYRLQYKPAEYLAIRELKKTEIGAEELSEKVAMMNEMQYFTFQIGLKDGSDILKSNIQTSDDYSKNIEYLSFEIQQHLSLIEGNDTLPCLLHHFERSYGIVPFANIIVAFQQKETQSDKIFMYDDQRFGAGIIQLVIKYSDLHNIPKINTK